MAARSYSGPSAIVVEQRRLRIADLRARQGRGAHRQPAVAHVGKHVDVLDARQQPDASVDLDVRGDPSRQRDAALAGGGERVRDEINAGAFERPLGHEGELLVGKSPQDPSSGAVEPRSRHRREELQIVARSAAPASDCRHRRRARRSRRAP